MKITVIGKSKCGKDGTISESFVNMEVSAWLE